MVLGLGLGLVDTPEQVGGVRYSRALQTERLPDGRRMYWSLTEI